MTIIIADIFFSGEKVEVLKEASRASKAQREHLRPAMTPTLTSVLRGLSSNPPLYHLIIIFNALGGAPASNPSG